MVEKGSYPGISPSPTQPAQRIVRHGVGVDRGVALEAQHTAELLTIIAVQYLVQVASWIEFVVCGHT
jgi:hypothetical protein